MIRKIILLFLFFTGIQLLFSQQPEALKVKEFVLDNGLTVWINEDHSQGKVIGTVVVKAGAKDSPDTGIAHYFEHIMFKGTDKIGTVDYEAEKVFLDSIAVKYDELAGSEDESVRKKIQADINRLSIEAARYAIPNEFSRLISQYGGSELNAFTSYDVTAYFNTFSPQYFAQWAELNSERLINPVFRLFQSELETVYEEKNMYDDSFGSLAAEKLLEKVFRPHPYMYPILGSTGNLKNPRLSEMQKFYNDYYVANNIGLLLCGDIYADEVLPVIEKTFGRLRAGDIPASNYPEPQPFGKDEEFSLKIPIPIVKAGADVWRSVPAYHEDELPLEIMIRLLTNSNGAGYLDKLSDENKVLMAAMINIGLEDAGVLAAFVIPKLFFQSTKKAKKIVEKEINKIRKANFTDEDIHYLKTELKREKQQNLEDIDSRSYTMINVFAQGKSWEDYINRVEKIDSCTKDDVLKVANKYLTQNSLTISKKTGNYPKNHLNKPDFEPITPPNKDTRSVYAQELEKIPLAEARPRFIDFEKDVVTRKIGDMVTLYMTENPVNDIFSLRISFGRGALESKLLEPLSYYLETLGTEKYSLEEFKNELQKTGSVMSFIANPESFDILIEGLDQSFDETMVIVKHFVEQVKNDEKKIKQVADIKKIGVNTQKNSSDFMSRALFEKVRYGEYSDYLNQLSLSEVKKLKGKQLLNEFGNVMKVECSIHYCGRLTEAQVVNTVQTVINNANVTIASNNPVYREPLGYTEPLVYFMNFSGSNQSIIYAYSKGQVNESSISRNAGELFSFYFGKGMSSLVFQEVREFRSLAYSAGARYISPPYKYRDKPGHFYAMLSTQNDKTLDAMSLLDSLIRYMPLKEERVQTAKQEAVNTANNDYPAFRGLSEKIQQLQQQGYETDPNMKLIADIEQMDMDNIARFYEESVRDNTLVYIIVGDEKKLDMNVVSQLGKIIRVKSSEVYR